MYGLAILRSSSRWESGSSLCFTETSTSTTPYVSDLWFIK